MIDAPYPFRCLLYHADDPREQLRDMPANRAKGVPSDLGEQETMLTIKLPPSPEEQAVSTSSMVDVEHNQGTFSTEVVSDSSSATHQSSPDVSHTTEATARAASAADHALRLKPFWLGLAPCVELLEPVGPRQPAAPGCQQ